MPKDYPDYDVLLSALKNNDLEAFDYLYHHQRNRLFILANSILDDPEVSRDLVQEVFLELFEKKHFLRIEAALKTYLYRFVRNRALNISRNRSIKLAQQRRFVIERSPEVHDGHVGLLEYNLDQQEIRREIENAIGTLPPMAEKVFRLHYLEHRSHEEIANQLRISKFTVSNHMDRALRGLRGRLKKDL